MTALSAGTRAGLLDGVWADAAAAADRRALAGVAWRSLGSCLARPDLPWTGEPEQVTVWDDLTMTTLCSGCPVLAAVRRPRPSTR